MASEEWLFPLEHVTGPVLLPPWDASVEMVQVWISVLNVGDERHATRVLGYRAHGWPSSPSPEEGVTPSVQLFDSGAAEVAPQAERLLKWIAWPPPDELTGQYWVKILATSEALVPSVEFAEFKASDDPGPGDIMCRYMPGDFAVFHQRIRYIQPVPVGPAKGARA